MTAYDKIVQLFSRLTLAEKIRLLEHLSTAIKQDVEIEAYRQMPWEQFLNLTYGSLADDPIERNQPGQPDQRSG